MKEENIRVLVMEPGKEIEECTVPNTLEALQELVGGRIEVVPYFTFLFIVDEEGKLKGKEPTMVVVHDGLDTLCGTVVAVGQRNEAFCSLSDQQIVRIRELYENAKVDLMRWKRIRRFWIS